MFKFDNLGLALGANLEFYTSVAKGLKLKVRNFVGLIPTFVEDTGGKLLGGGPFCLPPPKSGIGCDRVKINSMKANPENF